MSPWDRARVLSSRLRETLARGRIRRELDEEMRLHLDLETEHHRGRGLEPDEARRAALIAFGGVDRFREEASEARGFETIDQFSRDVRFAARQLRRSPAFTAGVFATLAIGIGASAAVFAVFHAVLVKPLPFPEPDRLAGAWWALPAMSFPRAPQSLSTYFTIRRSAKTIDGIAVFDRADVNLADGSDDSHPERVRAALATASTFSLLGTRFVSGRAFTSAEDVPRAPLVAVISEGLWRRRYGAESAIIGKHVLVDGRRYEIVGVASQRFRFPDDITQLWLPLALDSTAAFSGAFAHQGFVRLEPGITPAAAQREMDALMPRIAELYPNIAPGMPMAEFAAQARMSAVVRPMRADVVGNFESVVTIAATAGALLLLIAFANVTNLLLARAETRQRELAVRVALGAGAGRVMRQFLAESALLATVGGTGGLMLAAAGVRALVRSAPVGVPRVSEIGIDSSVVAFVAALTLGLALLATAVPVARYNAERLTARLRDGERGGTAGRDRQRMRRVLVVTQVAFATILVSGAGLMFQSLQRLRRANPGFDAAQSLALWVSLPKTTYPTDADIVRFTSQVLARAAVAPGVRAVGAASKVPLYGLGATYTPIWSDRDPGTSSSLPPSESIVVATGGYFGALGIPLLAGRAFNPAERQSAYEAIVDASLARQYWGDSTGRRAIGQRIRLTKDPKADSWYTVVGVVGSVADSSLAAPNNIVYLPGVVAPDTNRSNVVRTIALVVRSPAGVDPRSIRGAVEQAIAGVDRSVPPFNVKPMIDVVESSLARLWFVLVVVAVTAIVALLLAAIGLYGVLAFIVSTRSREMSIRMAMGALPGTVARLVTRQAVTLATAGVLTGAVVFFAGWRPVASLVAGVGRPAPATVVGTSLVLLTVAVLASWIPARRASRMDPARALAAE